MTAVDAIALAQGRSVGEVLSEFARAGLRNPGVTRTRNGIPLLPIRDPKARVTTDMINALRDEAS